MEELKNKPVSNEGVSLPDETLKKVSGGGLADDVSRVPENPIDDGVKEKF